MRTCQFCAVSLASPARYVHAASPLAGNRIIRVVAPPATTLPIVERMLLRIRTCTVHTVLRLFFLRSRTVDGRTPKFSHHLCD